MSKWKMDIQFTSGVAKQFKNKLSRDIVNAVEGSPAMRAEIRKVFQQANRRIQNIEKSGAFSPAVASLGKSDIKGYSKFSVKGFGNTGSDWSSLKKEYAKAVSFLNQPTSTSSGAKQFEKQVKSQMNVPDDLWDEIRISIMNGYNSVSSELLLALPYSDFMQEIYTKARDSSSSQMEKEAKEISDNLQKSIEQQADNIAEGITEGIQDSINSIAKAFKIDM